MTAHAGKQTFRTINSYVRFILKADVQVRVRIGKSSLCKDKSLPIFSLNKQKVGRESSIDIDKMRELSDSGMGVTAIHESH